jgi:hypothetical protein
MSDMDEFNQLAGTEVSEKTKRRNAYNATRNAIAAIPAGLDEAMNPEKEEKEETPGALNQFSHLAGGFVPSGTTIKKLPADCYRLNVLQTGQPHYTPQNLSTDELMRLPDSKSDEVIAEVRRFWTLKEKFTEYGFAHKRGFMLWGPPGSGKTSTISIIIRDMVKAGGAVFLAQHPGVLAIALRDFRAVEPERPLVVIWEDLDSVIEHYGESEVLSILDGESQVENVVFIATTNYPEKLDARITNRPSRFDKIVKIGMPNDEARRLYLETKINGPAVAPDGTDLVEASKDFSIAHLRELIVSIFCQGNDTKETIERLAKMKVTPVSTRGEKGIGF